MIPRAQSGGIKLARSATASADVDLQRPDGDHGMSTAEPWLHSSGPNSDRKRKTRGIGGRWVQVAYAVIDVFCVLLNGAIAFALRFSPERFRGLFSGHIGLSIDPGVDRYGGFLLLYVAFILLFCHIQDLYRTPRDRQNAEEFLAVIKAVSFATLVLTAFIYLSGVQIVSRSVVLVSLLLNVIALAAWRYAKRKIVIHRVERGINARNALIVGAGRVGQALAQEMQENKLLGYSFKGFLDGNHSTDPRVRGKVEDLPRIARTEFVNDVFITIPSERELVKRIAIEGRRNGLDVKVVPDMYDGLGWHAPIRHVGDFPVMDLHWQTIPALGLSLKRGLDASLSGLGLLLLLPLFGVLALWIRLDSEGPVLYRSRRVGQKGRVFTCYKLRTMVTNADELKDSLRHRNEREGPFFKISDDPRITRSGRLLRKYSLDELPQLWNVLKGEMSLVGPRPHPLDDYEHYDLDHLRRLDVKPGITGLWQVAGRQDPSFTTSMKLDLEYIQQWNLTLDFRILLRTAAVVAKGTGS
jgi:exopolysaccharide biosynthesis polyprenyl glycosylphosphotransferase